MSPMTSEQVIIEYFGEKAVEQAVMEYFHKHGLSEDTADQLSTMSIVRPKEFCEMVCNYIESNTKYMINS